MSDPTIRQVGTCETCGKPLYQHAVYVPSLDTFGWETEHHSKEECLENRVKQLEEVLEDLVLTLDRLRMQSLF